MTEKILLIEDCAVNRHMLAAVLRREGYELQLAADGETALAHAAYEPPGLGHRLGRRPGPVRAG